MTDIATISLRVNTSELERGNQALDKFQQSADKAAKAADGVGQSTGKMAASSKQIQEASDYLAKYNGGIDTYTKNMNRRAVEENKVGDAVAFQNGELEKLLNRINPLNKAFGELDSINKSLSQAKGLNLIDEVVYARYQAILDSTYDKLYKSEEALTEEGREKIKNARITEQLEESQQKLMQSLSGQAATFRASKSDIAEYRAAQLGISEQAAPIIASIREQEKALEREANQKRIAAIQSRSLKQAIKEMEVAERAATQEAKRADDSRKSFIKSLADQANAIGKTRTELLELKAAEMGVSAQAAPFIAKLREQDDAWKTGAISAGQYKQAMRQLPAQFTDIATSIAGGMPLWLVFMQQGGQISDSFGGVGNIFQIIKEKLFGLNDASGEASESLSDTANGLAENAENAGKLSSFLSPTKIGILGLAGAVVTLSIAWYQGSKELSKFNKSLILTGNFAGTTAGKLSLLSKSLSGGGLTQSNIAAALTAVVGSGAFSNSSLAMIADTAARLKDTVGTSIDDTVKQFQRLQNEPVNAVLELDKSLHFLKATQLEQITTLAEQGRSTDAAKIAMESYADAMRSRTESIKENLGSLEKAWEWLGEKASGAWDAMLNIGRETPVEVKIEAVRKQLELARKNLELMEATPPSDTGNYGYGRPSESLSSQQNRGAIERQKTFVIQLGKQLAELQEQSFQAEIKVGRAKADQDEETRKKNQFQADQDLKIKYENAEEKHQRELQRIKNSDASDSVKQLAVQRENERYQRQQERNNKALKGPAYLDDSATKMLSESKQRLASLIEQYGVSEKMTEQEKRLVEFNQQIADLKDKRILTADQKSILNRSTEIKSALELEASESRRLENQKKLNTLLESSRKYVTQMDEKGEALESASTISSRMASQKVTLAQLRIGWKNAGGNLDDARFKQQEEAAERYFSKEEALRGDWQTGVKRGFAEYADDATDTYGQVSRITQNAFQGMSVSITDFLFEGKASFDDFLKTFLKGIAQMMVQMTMLNAMKGAFGGTAVGSFFGFANGGLVPSFDTGGYTGDGGKFEPKGIVHGGEFVFTKAATEALGVSNLYALMRGAQGYAEGGVVGRAPMASIPALRPAPGNGGMVFNSSITVNGQTSQNSTPISPTPDGSVLKNQLIGLVSQQIDRALGQQGAISKFVDNKIGRR